MHDVRNVRHVCDSVLDDNRRSFLPRDLRARGISARKSPQQVHASCTSEQNRLPSNLNTRRSHRPASGGMPRKYRRKPGVVPREMSWTEETLALALKDLDRSKRSINEISRIYGISPRTLRRRREKKNRQFLTQGKYPTLGFENEKRLVSHISRLRGAGFPLERTAIQKLAYQLANRMGVKHNFNNETRMAGPQWLKSFLERNPNLKRAEGSPIEKENDLDGTKVTTFFDSLKTFLAENDLSDEPGRIYVMDETGVHLNDDPGRAVGVEDSLASGDEGETITVVACCNAIGNFLPPVLILGEENSKEEFEEGLPPSSKVYMEKKWPHTSSELIRKWFKEHFVVCKPPGLVLLILIGQSSLSSVADILETAWDNDVVPLCLPRHTASASRALNLSVFGPFQRYCHEETNNFKISCPQRQLDRYQSGRIISKAWMRAATPSNAMSGIRGSGIYPVNPNALSDIEVSVSDIALGQPAVSITRHEEAQPRQDRRSDDTDNDNIEIIRTKNYQNSIS